MANIFNLSCPSCDSKLEITEDIEGFACANCGNEYVVIRKGGIVTFKPIQADKKRYSHETWGGRSSFDYSGSVETGTEIFFGKGGWKSRVSAEVYRALRRQFIGRTVNIGTSRTEPPKGSMGEWLKANVTQAAIACYVGPILIIEGYAKRVGKHEICIIR